MELAFPVNKMSQLLMSFPDKALSIGHHVLQYLRATKGQKLIYHHHPTGHGKHDQLSPARSWRIIEVHTDASFAPDSARSQTGTVIMWDDAAVAWLSHRQATMSASTAEAELGSCFDGMIACEAITDLVNELISEPAQRYLYSDNIFQPCKF